MQIKTITDSRFCEAVSKPLVQSTSDATFATSVSYEPPAAMQLAGIYESLAVYLDPTTFKAAFIAAGAIVGSEVVKDAYKWVKSLFKRNCEAYDEGEQAQLKSKETRGIDFRIREETAEGHRSHVEIKYIASDETSAFDEEFFTSAMKHFEVAVLPVIAFWGQHGKYGGITSIIIQGQIDARAPRYSWTVAIDFDDGPVMIISIGDSASTDA